MNHDDLIIAQYHCGRCNKQTHVLAQRADRELLPSPLQASFGCQQHKATLTAVQSAVDSVGTLDLVLARITIPLLRSLAESSMIEVGVDEEYKEEQIKRLYQQYQNDRNITILLPVEVFHRYLQHSSRVEVSCVES